MKELCIYKRLLGGGGVGWRSRKKEPILLDVSLVDYSKNDGRQNALAKNSKNVLKINPHESELLVLKSVYLNLNNCYRFVV